MTEREKRSQRKTWRKWDEKRRQKKDNRQLPPTPPDEELNNSGNKTRGRKVVLKNRSKCVRDNQKLQKELMEMENKLKHVEMRAEKYKKRLSRMRRKNDENLKSTPECELTPISKAKKFLGTPFKKLSRNELKRSQVVHTLVFHESVVNTLNTGYKSLKEEGR